MTVLSHWVCCFVLWAVLAQAAGVRAQSGPGRTELGMGAFLAVTAERAQDEDVVGLNVLPLSLQWAFHARLGVRMRSLLNLDLVGSKGLMHRGGSLALHAYLTGSDPPRSGLYAGPVVGFSRLPGRGNHDLTLASELGYHWALAQAWSLDLCGQLGATRLARTDATTWSNHFGIYPGVTYWAF